MSDVNLGSFRPQMTYSSTLNKYLITWEDRCNASGQPYCFDVYVNELSGQFTLLENNLALAIGGDYTNYDFTVTWTPRPAVTGGDNNFLTVWFVRTIRAVR